MNTKLPTPKPVDFLPAGNPHAWAVTRRVNSVILEANLAQQRTLEYHVFKLSPDLKPSWDSNIIWTMADLNQVIKPNARKDQCNLFVNGILPGHTNLNLEFLFYDLVTIASLTYKNERIHSRHTLLAHDLDNVEELDFQGFLSSALTVWQCAMLAVPTFDTRDYVATFADALNNGPSIRFPAHTIFEMTQDHLFVRWRHNTPPTSKDWILIDRTSSENALKRALNTRNGVRPLVTDRVQDLLDAMKSYPEKKLAQDLYLSDVFLFPEPEYEYEDLEPDEEAKSEDENVLGEAT